MEHLTSFFSFSLIYFAICKSKALSSLYICFYTRLIKTGELLLDLRFSLPCLLDFAPQFRKAIESRQGLVWNCQLSCIKFCFSQCFRKGKKVEGHIISTQLDLPLNFILIFRCLGIYLLEDKTVIFSRHEKNVFQGKLVYKDAEHKHKILVENQQTFFYQMIGFS